MNGMKMMSKVTRYKYYNQIININQHYTEMKVYFSEAEYFLKIRFALIIFLHIRCKKNKNTLIKKVLKKYNYQLPKCSHYFFLLNPLT